MPLIDELTTAADQLERMAEGARFGGPDTSVRVTDPTYLIDLLRRAASMVGEARRPAE